MRLALRSGMVVVVAVAVGVGVGFGQAAALPGAAVVSEGSSGRGLMGEMVSALGGEAWVGWRTSVVEGRVARFYKGEAVAGAEGFEESVRRRPFGERWVVVSHYGALVARDHRDVMEVWTGAGGWEITYKGTTALGAKEVEGFERGREHSVEAVVGWLGEQGTEVRFVGERLVESERVDEVEVVQASGEGVTVLLNAGTHLPVSVSWRWRDGEFGDWDTEAEEFADWHGVSGVMTPYVVTMRRNGDVTEERFVTSVRYNLTLGDDVFDPQQRLKKK